MRFDVLQIGAWTVGLYLIVAGLVAVARAGFDDLGLFESVVEVGDQTATPLYALLWLLIAASFVPPLSIARPGVSQT